jgi:CrcB protein
VKAALSNALLVGAGGFTGALLRWGTSGFVHRQLPFATFPYGTLVVNGIGCLAIGVMMGLAESRQLFGPELRTFVLVGLLGGFTTFSTFGYETVAMLRDGEHLRASTNVGAQVALGLFAVWLGYTAASAR